MQWRKGQLRQEECHRYVGKVKEDLQCTSVWHWRWSALSTNPSAKHRRPFSLQPGSSSGADAGCGSPEPVSTHAPQMAGRCRTSSYSGQAGQPCRCCVWDWSSAAVLSADAGRKSDSSTGGRPREVYSSTHHSQSIFTFNNPAPKMITSGQTPRPDNAGALVMAQTVLQDASLWANVISPIVGGYLIPGNIVNLVLQGCHSRRNLAARLVAKMYTLH